MAKDSNPVLNGIIKKYQRNNTRGFSGFSGGQTPYGFSPHGNDGLAPMSYSPTGTRPITRALTYEDVVSKTALSLGIIVITAVIDYMLCLSKPALGMLLGMIGLVVGFCVVFANFFSSIKGKSTSPAKTLTYAVAEGAALGWFTWVIAYQVGQTATFPWIAAQALFATLGVFIAMLAIYKNRVIRVTPRFNKLMLSSILGVLFMVLGSGLISLFTGNDILRDGGVLSICFSIGVIVIASLSFLTDFDNAETLIKIGAPEEESWGIALGLSVGIVWLYTEIIRLLSYFSRD